MDDRDKKLNLVNEEISQKKKQITAIRESYSLARDMLSGVERQLRALEDQYESIVQGQLPLESNDSPPEDH